MFNSDSPITTSRTLYSSLPNQIIFFERKKTEFNSNFGFNNKNDIKGFKTFARITLAQNGKGDISFGGVSNQDNPLFIFWVQSGNKVKKIDNNWNIIHKKQRYNINYIDNKENEDIYFKFYCSKLGEKDKEQNEKEQKPLQNKDKGKVEW